MWPAGSFTPSGRRTCPRRGARRRRTRRARPEEQAWPTGRSDSMRRARHLATALSTWLPNACRPVAVEERREHPQRQRGRHEQRAALQGGENEVAELSARPDGPPEAGWLSFTRCGLRPAVTRPSTTRHESSRRRARRHLLGRENVRNVSSMAASFVSRSVSRAPR